MTIVLRLNIVEGSEVNSQVTSTYYSTLAKAKCTFIIYCKFLLFQVFSNWAQFRITLHYLSTMTNEQTLSMMSGHPAGNN